MDQNTNQPEQISPPQAHLEVDNNNLQPSNNGKKSKLLTTAISAVVVILIGGGLMWYLARNKTTMPNDLKSQFISFFKDLRVAASRNDLDFVKKTMPQTQIESLKRLKNMSEEQVIADQAKDIAEVKDEMIVGYDCKDNVCSVTVMWYNDPQNTTKWEYVFSNNNWLSKNDSLPSLDQLNILNNLANEYSISFYRKGSAVFKLYLNGKEIESVAVTDPKGDSTNRPLLVNSGENKLEIEITPTAAGNQQITYRYDLYQLPKGTNQNAIFNDEYKLATSEQFVHLILNKTEKIEIPFTAK